MNQVCHNVMYRLLCLQVFTDDGPENPLVGSYAVEELLDVFSSSAMVKLSRTTTV